MIRATQREELAKLRNNLAELGKATAPSLQTHVILAVCSGESPKLRSEKEIVSILRAKIAKDRYHASELKLTDVFASTGAFLKEKAAFDAYEKKRQKCVAAFQTEAGKIMIRALDKNAEVTEIMEDLHLAAEKAGLKGLTVPDLSVPEEE